MIRESERSAPSGLAAIVVLFLLFVLCGYALREAVRWQSILTAIGAVLAAACSW
jgi:hypothetical protein